MLSLLLKLLNLVNEIVSKTANLNNIKDLAKDFKITFEPMSKTIVVEHPSMKATIEFTSDLEFSELFNLYRSLFEKNP